VTPGVNRRGVELLEESLDMLPAGDSALRAELLARLGTEIYYDADWSRAEDLTADALAIAERLGEDSITAYVLTARQFVLQRPEVPPSRRIELADLLDLSGPIEQIGQLDCSACSLYDILVADGFAYVSDDFSGLGIFDVSDPTAPRGSRRCPQADPSRRLPVLEPVAPRSGRRRSESRRARTPAESRHRPRRRARGRPRSL